MAKTRPNITLPSNTWVNIYAALNAQGGYPSVTIGDKLKVENIGRTDIKMVADNNEPDNDDGFNPLYQRDIRVNESGDPGAWFYSMGFNGLINVSIVE